MSDIFFELSMILIVAAVLSYISSMLRQPLLVGYILTGIVVGPSLLNLVSATEVVATFSQLGVTLLLFMVGLNLNPKMIRDLGKVSVYSGLGQILFTVTIGFLITSQLGYPLTTALYIAIAITFSSTIIIMKLLSDRGELHSLYGRVAVGILLVQDFVAVFLMIAISSMAQGSMNSVLTSMLAGVGLMAALAFVSRYVLPVIDGTLTKSTELLFLASIAWCLMWASLFEFVGFNIEVGALLAGVALSITQYGPQISARVKPLRDFFIVLFFILLGTQLQFGSMPQRDLIAAAVLVPFVLIGNPLIIMWIMRAQRFPRHAGFSCGLTVAQISEFSLILIALGVKLGHLPSSIMSLMTIIALATIGVSSYMIMYSDILYKKVSPYLSFFEPKGQVKKTKKRAAYSSILFGFNRIGTDLLEPLHKLKGETLVIDYNPQVITELEAEGIDCMYGDIEDVSLFEEVDLKKPKIMISTIPYIETNLRIISHIRAVNKKAVVIMVAHQIQEALDLYDAGVNFVLLPHFVGGRAVSSMIRRHKTSKKYYAQLKKQQINYLLDRMARGHEHPEHEMRR